MDVRPEQQSVVQAVLTPGGDRADVGCMQDRGHGAYLGNQALKASLPHWASRPPK
jgi:hypothetical protein